MATVRAGRPDAGPAAARAWLWYLTGGAACAVGYFVLPVFDVPVGAREGWYVAVCASAAVALVVGVRCHRPVRRAPWYLLCGAQVLYAAADLVFYLCRQVLGIERYPYYDDLVYLCSYLLLAAGLVLLLRARTPGWDLPTAIDSLILTIVAGLLLWVYLVGDTAFAPDDSLAAQSVSIAYPALDLLLLTLGIRLFLGAGAGTVTHRLLYASMSMMLVADVGYSYEEQTGEYLVGGALDAIWIASALSLGAAGLHSSMPRLTERSAVATPDTSPGRLAMLCLAATTAPAVLLVQHLRGVHTDVLPVALACLALFPLTLARMADLVAVQRRMASTDPLTGLRTRRFVTDRLRRNVASVGRSGGPLSLLLVDIDHFKRVNDTYGHDGGDVVLRAVGRILAGAIRRGDTAARYGGEEFAVLLPGLDATDAATLANRIRTTLCRTPITIEADGRTLAATVTMSVGVASIPDHASGADTLMTAADRALYAAKRAGRNRVVTGAPTGGRAAAERQPV